MPLSSQQTREPTAQSIDELTSIWYLTAWGIGSQENCGSKTRWSSLRSVQCRWKVAAPAGATARVASRTAASGSARRSAARAPESSAGTPATFEVGRRGHHPARSRSNLDLGAGRVSYAPWHFLNFLPDPHQHGSLR